ncbi:hypothetical protein EVAR_65211_1 [Eumeta japonica]|uniref:Uncharacterized protein n=1 Tax=Eumeta variegata TaxID=151549 RepID=A0A4C1ZIC9_EUMVA|nr:hypothetical protein EVAR_65211_1 [Eumeta japonica]
MWTCTSQIKYNGRARVSFTKKLSNATLERGARGCPYTYGHPRAPRTCVHKACCSTKDGPTAVPSPKGGCGGEGVGGRRGDNKVFARAKINNTKELASADDGWRPPAAAPPIRTHALGAPPPCISAFKASELSRDKRACDSEIEYRWSPLPMDTRDFRGIISALPTSWTTPWPPPRGKPPSRTSCCLARGRRQLPPPAAAHSCPLAAAAC